MIPELSMLITNIVPQSSPFYCAFPVLQKAMFSFRIFIQRIIETLNFYYIRDYMIQFSSLSIIILDFQGGGSGCFIQL